MSNEDSQNKGIRDHIEGFDAVVDYFGIWPSFHDSEIMSLQLDRGAPSLLRIWVKPDGFRSAQRQGVVTFRFEKVLDLELRDFSHQNVIFGLDIARTENGYKIFLGPCYGLSGWLEVSALTVEVLSTDSF